MLAPICGSHDLWAADGSHADAVAEAEEFTLDAPVQRGFCLASRRTNSRISSDTGGRPVVFG